MLSLVWLFPAPLDCSPPGSSVHRIIQARRLEWVSMSSSRRSSWSRDQTQVSWISCIGKQIFLLLSHLGNPYLVTKELFIFTKKSGLICPLEGHTVAMSRLLDSWMPSASTKTLKKVKFSPNFSHLIFEKGVKVNFCFLNFCWSIADFRCCVSSSI